MGVEGNQAMVASVAAVAMATAMAMAMVTGGLKISVFILWRGSLGLGDSALKISQYFSLTCGWPAAAVTEQKSVYVYRGFSIIAISALR